MTDNKKSPAFAGGRGRRNNNREDNPDPRQSGWKDDNFKTSGSPFFRIILRRFFRAVVSLIHNFYFAKRFAKHFFKNF